MSIPVRSIRPSHSGRDPRSPTSRPGVEPNRIDPSQAAIAVCCEG